MKCTQERCARQLGERLKDRVLCEIFPQFASGFLLSARRSGQLPQDLDASPEEERNRLLEPFFNGTLTFLYRLLFLLYAESRDLLPVREVRGYYQKSLEKLKREIADTAGSIEEQAPARLKAAYNEFSTALYDQLQELFCAVDRGDSDLNVPACNGGLFVTQPDSFDSSPGAEVAHFLSGCKIPDRQLALGLDRLVRDLDPERLHLAFIDYEGLDVRLLGSIYEGLLAYRLRIAPRSVYLENDRSGRRAAGSYYTPDYIVKYIVEHTVGPVLQEKLDALRPVFRDAEQSLRAGREQDGVLRSDDINAEQATYKKFHKLNNDFFDLKVLDPAMGSGHFLVEAVDFITDRLADFLTAFPWNPVIHELSQTRREIQQEMERQGVTIDMSKLTDLNLLRRRILKSCIYGVDLDPVAVEFARISLWLHCFALGSPLTFLDHHLKCGNSLIGGSVQEVQDALSRQAVEKAYSLTVGKRFFHWEREFPEVFFDEAKRNEDGGFDAVVGNPPYINANELNKALAEFDKPFWKAYFKSASGAYDLYILFIEQAIHLSHTKGFVGLITPNKFLATPYAVAFRDYFCSAAKLLRLLNLSHVRVFDDPAIYPVVMIAQKAANQGRYDIAIETVWDAQNPALNVCVTQDSENLTRLPEKIWGFLISESLPLILKAQGVSSQLQDCATVRASSTASEADMYGYALSNVPSGNSKKFINTGLIDRYDVSWGLDSLTHKGQVFVTPYLDLSAQAVPAERGFQYGKAKLVFAKMAQRMEAFLDDRGEFASANTNFVYDSQYDLRYLQAVLNSHLMLVLYNGYFGSLQMSGGYFQFQAPQLRILPIRHITFSTSQQDRACYLEMARNLYQSYLDKDDRQCALDFVDHHLSRQPEASDVVHDLLAFLAGEMNRLNKEKRAAQRAFLDWLLMILKIRPDKEDRKGIEVLTGKSKLRDYAGDYRKGEPPLTSTDLLEILQKNKGHLGVNLSDAALIDRIRKEYEENLQGVLPIKERLRKTDTLIDAVVYRLYGLTE